MYNSIIFFSTYILYKMNCNVCLSKLRKTNYELHYIGIVCSKCFRMSKKKYCELVDLIALRKINFILKEILNDKEKYLLN